MMRIAISTLKTCGYSKAWGDSRPPLIRPSNPSRRLIEAALLWRD
jgi:hypothetical protein